MIYVFFLLDNANSVHIRQQFRASHKDYIGKVADRISFAGPLLGDDGETRMGSLLAIDFPDREAAKRWLKDEPYTREGLFAGVHIHAFQDLW